MKTLRDKGAGGNPIRPNAAGFFPRLVDGFYFVALGNGRQYEVSLQRDGEALFIGVMGQGFWRFTSYVHASYAMEKLKLSLSDGSLFADFINDQLPERDVARQGLNFVDADLHREWEQDDFAVSVTKSVTVSAAGEAGSLAGRTLSDGSGKSTVLESDEVASALPDVEEVALVSVTVVTSAGCLPMAELLAADALKMGQWGAEKLFNDSTAPAPKMLGSVVQAGGGAAATDAAERSIAESLAARHNERVQAALGAIAKKE